jgi:hypothetical protein
MTEVMRDRVTIALCGLLGVAALGVYYSVPLPLPEPGASVTAIVEFGTRYHTRILLDAWLQAVGSLLAVVFFAAIAHLAGGLTKVFGWIAVMGMTSVLAMSLLDVVLVLGAIEGAARGHLTTAQTCFDLTYVFIHVFPIVPAAATFFGLGGLLVRTTLLPRSLGLTALMLAVAFAVLGFVGLFQPSVNGVMVVLLSAQEVWIVAAAACLVMAANRSPRDVALAVA